MLKDLFFLKVFLNSLKTATGLKLPYGFNLKKIDYSYNIKDNIKEEIMNNPDKYYMAPPTEEDKKGIKR